MAAGSQHTLVVKTDGTVWAFGDNGSGQLGDNTTTVRRVPQAVSGLSNIVAVAAGTAHSLALSSGGTVYAWGHNSYGTVGDGTTTQRRTPVALSLTSVVAIAAGEYHSAALTSSGDVYVWGRNNASQLGNGNTSNVTSPWLLTTGAQAVGAGGTHTLVVKTDGTVWGTGTNTNGQLGDGTTTSRTTLAQASGLSTVVAAAAGAKHSVFLLADGSVWATGVNTSGELGDGTTTQRSSAVEVGGLTGVSAIAVGSSHTLAATTAGALYAWGDNTNGGLGDGSNTDRLSPVAVANVGAIVAFSAGQRFSVAYTSAGYVWVAGRNNSSQLGNGTTVDVWDPVSISYADFAWRVAAPTFSVAPGTYTSDRTVAVSVVTAGATIHYTQNGAEPTESDPVVASGGTVVVSQSQTLKARAWKSGMPASNVSSAAYTMQVAQPNVSPSAGTYTSARTVTLTTSTAGATLHYTLDGSEPTTASPAYSGALTIATTTTLKARGFKANWSDSVERSATYTMNFGTLTAPTVGPGAGTFTGQVMVTLEAQPFATIRYTVNGGTPNTSSPLYTAPFPVDVNATVRAKAFHPDYTASAVAQQTYALVTSTPVIDLAPGSYAPGTALVVTSPDADTTLRWTLDGSDPTASSPVLDRAVLIGDFTIKVRGFRTGAAESAVASGSYTLAAPLGSGAVSAGSAHTLLATPEGMLYAWGNNSSGELGIGSSMAAPTPALVPTLTGVVAVAAGSNHSLAATHDGQLWAWGNNTYGRLGDGTTFNRNRPVPIAGLPPVVAVAAGASHSLALTSTGQVYAFGAGSQGQLGQNATSYALVPQLVDGLTDVVAIAAGSSHSLAVTTSGALWAWGNNSSNQVAPGATTNRLVPTLITDVSTVVSVTAGSAHTLARLRDGSVRVWGSGSGGKLGLGTQTDQTAPVVLPSLSTALLVAGENHSGAVALDGTLYGWGVNGSGRVGDGTTTNVLSPAAVTGPTGVTALTLGGDFSVTVALDGGVWTWGAAHNGRLGDGTTTNRLAPALAWTAPGRWSPPAPLLSLAAGTYATEQVVLATSAVPGATLRYTTTGVDPTDTDPAVPAGGDLLITATTTLKVRAWVPDRAPSVVASATYTLQPAAPTLTPATGTYVGAQTVTLASSDPLAALRYTVDGSTPDATSTLYTAPFLVSASAVVQARTFRGGWTPSAVTTATLTVVQGTLTAPTADLADGLYTTAQNVALQGPVGATVHYTIDGTDPTVSSPAATGAIPLDQGTTTLKARAFQDGWAPSETLTRVYTLDWTPPTITIWSPLEDSLHRSPTVTVEGVVDDEETSVAGVACNGVPATVDAGLFSCIVTLSQGPNTIAMAATDAAGHQAALDWAVRFDGTFTLAADASLQMPSSSWASAGAYAMVPDGATVSYQWTQTAGPAVTLIGANTPLVSFLTPAVRGPLQLQVVATSGGETRTAVVDTTITDVAEELMLSAGALSGQHTSTIDIAGTSLVYPFTWRGAAHPLQVTLTAVDAATLNTTHEEDPLRITLETADDEVEVTTLFSYDAQAGTLTLNALDAAAFEALLSPGSFSALRVSGLDSADRAVLLGVSLLHGRADLAGQVVAAPGSSASIAALPVMLTGTKHGLRATTSTDALGAFQFNGLIDDIYTVRVVDGDGQIGLELVDVEDAPGAHTVSLGIMAWPEPPAGLAGGDLNLGPLVGVSANPWNPVEMATATVPAGTKWLHLTAELGAGGDEPFNWAAAGASHSCQVTTATGAPINNGFTYVVLLDDRVIATGNGSHCGTAMEQRFGASLLDRLINVSAVTFERDAEVRLAIRSSPAVGYGYAASIGVSVGIDKNFTIRSVAATPGPGPLEAFKEEVRRDPKGNLIGTGLRMLGIPQGSTSTINKWGLAIKYLPDDVTISNVRVFVQQASGAAEDLAFTLAPVQTPGVVTLTHVGFPARGGVSPLWADKSEKVELMVEIQARQEDGRTATQVRPLGYAVTDKKPQGWALRPLYHAGGIPGARRTPGSFDHNHEAAWGGDAWGTKDANAYVSQHKALLMFNDLSVEPGGPFPGTKGWPIPNYVALEHSSHQKGTSIDARYPGVNLGGDELDWIPTVRRNRWQQAKDGDLNARQEMAAWIRAVRANLETLMADDRVLLIYIGASNWNYKSIMNGTFSDSTTNVLDETGQWIGAWQPTGGVSKIRKAAGHDDHIHVEVRK